MSKKVQRYRPIVPQCLFSAFYILELSTSWLKKRLAETCGVSQSSSYE